MSIIRKKFILAILCGFFACLVRNSVAAQSASQATPPLTVACYYFGNYDPGDPRNEKSKGKAWSEWELVKAARPQLPGHHQPNVPLWGCTDESHPEVMAQKIDAAANHGIRPGE